MKGRLQAYLDVCDDGGCQSGVGAVFNFCVRKPSCGLELNVSIFEVVSMDLGSMEIVTERFETRVTFFSGKTMKVIYSMRLRNISKSTVHL